MKEGEPLLDLPAKERGVCQDRQAAGDHGCCAGCLGDLQRAVRRSEAGPQPLLAGREDELVVEPGLGVVGRRRSLPEQPQRLLDQRQPGGGILDRPDIGGAVVDDRRGGRVGVISEPAVGLLGHHTGALTVAG